MPRPDFPGSGASVRPDTSGARGPQLGRSPRTLGGQGFPYDRARPQYGVRSPMRQTAHSDGGDVKPPVPQNTEHTAWHDLEDALDVQGLDEAGLPFSLAISSRGRRSDSAPDGNVLVQIKGMDRPHDDEEGVRTDYDRLAQVAGGGNGSVWQKLRSALQGPPDGARQTLPPDMSVREPTIDKEEDGNDEDQDE